MSGICNAFIAGTRLETSPPPPLEIRGGLQDGLAQAFLSGCGQVTEARDVWKGYSRGMSSESTTNLVKSAISNLRKAIREAIRKE